MKNPLTKSPSSKLLFDTPERPSNIFVANVDGASRGNPGPASYAVILRGPDGVTRFEVGKYIGRATNNVAEYYGLITALDYAASQGIDRLQVRSDSELLVRQMQGRYKVKSADLQPLYERARKLAHGFAYFAIEHVRREQNREADELANIALDRTSSRGSGSVEPGAKLGATSDAARGVKSDSGAETKRSAKSDPTSVAKTDAQSGVAQDTGGERGIRARYSSGALHPLEALDLAEGEIVEISIRRPRNPS
jgi:ribonuclease HI